MLLAAFVRDGWSGCLRRRTQLSAPGRACISERLCTYIISNQRYSVTITIITITNLTSNNLTSNNKLKRKSTDSLKKILYCNISFFTYFGETEKSLLLDVRLLDVRWHVFGKTMFCNCNYCNCNAVTRCNGEACSSGVFCVYLQQQESWQWLPGASHSTVLCWMP